MFKNLTKLLGVGSEENSYYIFMDDVTTESCRACIEWILSANFSEERPKQLTMLICSQGGDVHAAFALIDIMRGSTIPISTVAIGGIASAGTFIFMAGEPGYRILTPNTSIMSHQFSGGSVGKEHELFAVVKEFQLTAERIIAHYKKCTGMTEKVIKDELLPSHDIYLSHSEAMKYGIADVVKTLR